MQGNLKLYGLFIGLIVTMMITYDTLVYKIFNIDGFKITDSGIVFLLYFLISTILTEVYGYKLSVMAAWVMVLCQYLYALILNSASLIQVENNELASNYYHLYHEFWWVIVGAGVTVPVSYFFNGFSISKMKVVFSGRYFFFRDMIGSMSTQVALLLTAYPFSLSGKYSVMELVNIISTTWSYKVIISIVLLPLAIIMVGLVKKIEKAGHYDREISYNPFK